MTDIESLKRWVFEQLRAEGLVTDYREVEEIFFSLEKDRNYRLRFKELLEEYKRDEELAKRDTLDEIRPWAQYVHDYLTEKRRVIYRTPPGRGNRGVPDEVSVEFDEYTRKRAETFSEVAAALAETNPEIREFRARFLGGEDTRLTEERAGAMLYGEDPPPRDFFDRLDALAQRLSAAYRWSPDAAKWFVLTGEAPYVSPLTVRVSSYASAEEHYPNTTEITITVEPWVKAEQVENAYREVQRQIRGGDNREKEDRTLDAARFVARQILEHGDEPWTKRTERWNRAQEDPERLYTSRGALSQAFKRFLRPDYNRPNYKPSELEPWQIQKKEHARRFIEEHLKKYGPPKPRRRSS